MKGSWRRLVAGNPDLPAGVIDRHAYVLCVLEALWKALRYREVYATDSKRWGDPRAKLLDGPAWDRIKSQVLVGLKFPEDVEEHLGEQCGALDAAWRNLAARIDASGESAMVRVEPGKDGRARIKLDPLGRAEEPASLAALRERTTAMLPHVDLPQLLLEVHSRADSCPNTPPTSPAPRPG